MCISVKTVVCGKVVTDTPKSKVAPVIVPDPSRVTLMVHDANARPPASASGDTIAGISLAGSAVALNRNVVGCVGEGVGGASTLPHAEATRPRMPTRTT